MIEIKLGIIIYCLINIIWILISKPQKGKHLNLYCGLFGGSFNRPIDEVILQKLKMLGAFNQSRGKDSCGYFNGEEIFKGIDKNKEFFEFVVNEGIIMPENRINNIFIGHTRQSSVGAATLANAHPFLIENEDTEGKKGKNLILAHNGTIKEWMSLCGKYQVNHSKIFVDSLALGHMLIKAGPPVLNEYKGTAALLMHKTNEKGVLYVYHGASKEKKDGEPVEERPLFWLHTKEGVYLSSLEGALRFIADPYNADEVIEKVPYNKVIKIKDGVVSKKPYFVVDRGDNNVVTYTTYHSGGYDDDYYDTCRHGMGQGFPNYGAQKTIDFKRHNPEIQTTLQKLDVNTETPPLSKTKGAYLDSANNYLYFHLGRHRYTQNGLLAEGEMLVCKNTGKLLTSKDEATRPLKLYFYAGILLKSEDEYRLIVKSIVNKERWYNIINSNIINFAKAIAEYSKYPVTLLNAESSGIDANEDRLMWYCSNDKGFAVPATSERSFQPLFSDRIYHFANGHLVKVQSKSEEKAFVGFQEYQSKTNVANLVFDKPIIDFALRFNKIYQDLDDCVNTLGDDGWQVLMDYAKELADEKYARRDDEALVNNIANELINSAVLKNTTISSLLLPELRKIEFIIQDYLEELETEEAEKVENDSPFVEDVLEKALNGQDDESIHDAGIEEAEKEQMVEDTEIQDKLIEDVQAADKSTELYKAIESLSRLGNEFGMLNHSDMAQDIQGHVSASISTLKTQLLNIYSTNNKTEAVLQIKKINEII